MMETGIRPYFINMKASSIEFLLADIDMDEAATMYALEFIAAVQRFGLSRSAELRLIVDIGKIACRQVSRGLHGREAR